MSQHSIKKSTPDTAAWEEEIRRRLRRGKARLLITNIFCFILALAAMFFVI